MTYIKKLVMHGFKSFARKTDVPFENSMNIIVGPNGSGKSNVTDALCFVLGRLSIKSIRAAKAANLLFSGNKLYKGAQEASVELVFDNAQKDFALDATEVSIKRIVRKNGQSIYKINGITKTRQELLELLSHVGIDPNGFNLVLQGEIQSLVKATSEERRKILEDVAGISIYETRKEKSLRELEKTEEKLKEVHAVLKERNAYLRNLEKERADAMNFQKLDMTIKQCKKTLLMNALKDKEKEVWGIKKVIENNASEIDKLKLKIREKDVGIEELQVKIIGVNKEIQDITNNEQEQLHNEVSDLKAELAGLTVRRDNFETRIAEGREKIDDIDEKIKTFEKEMQEMKSASPDIKKQQAEHKSLQESLDGLEQRRRRYYVLKSELSTLEHQRDEKERFLITSQKEVEIIEKNLASLFSELTIAKSLHEADSIKLQTRHAIEEMKSKIDSHEEKILAIERHVAVLADEIKREESLKNSILDLKSCPVCKQDVNETYKNSIQSDSDKKIFSARDKEGEHLEKKDVLMSEIKGFRDNLMKLQARLSDIDIAIVKLHNAETRKEEVKEISDTQSSVRDEMKSLDTKIASLKKEFDSLKSVEDEYDDVRMRLQDLSFASIDVDSEVGIKQREISRLSVEKKSLTRDVEESEVELSKIVVIIDEKSRVLAKKEEREHVVYQKAKDLFSKKNELEDSQKVLETDILGLQHNMRSYEEKIQNNKIELAQFDAQITSLKEESHQFESVDVLKIPTEQAKDRLQKAQFRITQLGNVNLRALEVFDQVVEQVKLIEDKAQTVEGEKEHILSIIAEIDRKKKRAFLSTLKEVNDIFTRNFSQLFQKGDVNLELEDKKDPFNGGVNIVVRFSRGRLFDVTSLSGGEKTMIALSLIFAIQEYKPYSFYIFDEIDAALDKKNSELLAGLIKRYMKTGQYIIITHNDTLISEASTLYGVSMQENISKIISLKV